MNIIIVGPMIAIFIILLAELFIEMRQRYKDWRR
jgi:hypothetical protein